MSGSAKVNPKEVTVGIFSRLAANRFFRFFLVGSTIEAVRMIIFYLLFGKAESWESNLYSLLVSLLLGYPLFFRFVWSDRRDSWKSQALRYSLVSLVVVAVKLPLLERLLLLCPDWQAIIEERFGWLSQATFILRLFYDLFLSCVNLVTAAMDLVVAVGLKYFLFDRVVFVIRRLRHKEGS